MSQTCPTVTVKADNEQGCMVINESDFDAELHQLFGVESDKALSKAELQTALTGKGIEHKPAMSKAELQAMLGAA